MSAPFLTLPSSSCIATVVFGMIRVVGATNSPFNLEEQKFKWPGEAWTIDFAMPPIMNKNTAAEWRSFALGLKGRYGSFLIGDPLGKTPRGVATGTPVVDGAGQTDGILITKGWTPSTNNILRAGDYIQLGVGQNAKLHMLTEDANSDSSGVASLTIVPDLRLSPANESTVIINNAQGVFSLNGNNVSWSVNPGPVYRISFQATEAVSA